MMFSPAQNFRSQDFVAPSPRSLAMKRSADASSESVKEFAVHSFDEVDLSKLSVTQRADQKNGKPFFNASYDNQRFIVNLAPKKKWLQIPYAIESSKYAREEGNTETVRVQVALDDEVADVMKRVGDRVKEQVLAKMPDVKWYDSVKSAETGHILTAKMVLKAPDEKNLTLCTVRPFKQEVVKAAGKEVLGPLLEANRGFARSRAKVVVSLHGVWFMKESDTDSWVKKGTGKTGNELMAGITWRVVNLMADLPEQTKYVFQDVFANVSFSDEEE